jgi:hypothetical protein
LIGHQAVHEVEQVLELPALPHGCREVDVHVVPGKVDVLIPRRLLADRVKPGGVGLEHAGHFAEVVRELRERGRGVSLPVVRDDGPKELLFRRPYSGDNRLLIGRPVRTRQGVRTGQVCLEERAPLTLSHHRAGGDVAHERSVPARDEFDVNELRTAGREVRREVLRPAPPFAQGRLKGRQRGRLGEGGCGRRR